MYQGVGVLHQGLVNGPALPGRCRAHELLVADEKLLHNGRERVTVPVYMCVWAGCQSQPAPQPGGRQPVESRGNGPKTHVKRQLSVKDHDIVEIFALWPRTAPTGNARQHQQQRENHQSPTKPPLLPHNSSERSVVTMTTRSCWGFFFFFLRPRMARPKPSAFVASRLVTRSVVCMCSSGGSTFHFLFQADDPGRNVAGRGTELCDSHCARGFLCRLGCHQPPPSQRDCCHRVSRP